MRARSGTLNEAIRTTGMLKGKQADLVILDTYHVADVLLDILPRAWAIKNGRIRVVTHHQCNIHRH